MSDDWQDDPYLRELARELRERLGDEFREDSEEAEALASRWFARSRTLADIAAHLRDRGDTVAVSAGGQVLTGRVVYVADDYLTLDTPAAPVEVNLAADVALRVVERAPSGGIGGNPGPKTLRARLLELELEGTHMDLATTVFDGLRPGHIDATAKDHIVFRGVAGEEWYIGLEAILYLVLRA